jgi:hypothetical protein
VDALVASTGGFATIFDSHVKQPGDDRQRSGKLLGTRPPSVLPASKAIEGVKRHKALVRNAAPVARLAVGPVPSAEPRHRENYNDFKGSASLCLRLCPNQLLGA